MTMIASVLREDRTSGNRFRASYAASGHLAIIWAMLRLFRFTALFRDSTVGLPSDGANHGC